VFVLLVFPRWLCSACLRGVCRRCAQVCRSRERHALPYLKSHVTSSPLSIELQGFCGDIYDLSCCLGTVWRATLWPVANVGVWRFVFLLVESAAVVR
jgi:hypothetical protein